MTLEKIYELAGGSLDDVLKRIPSRELVIKLVKMFLDDPSKGKLDKAVLELDCEGAFKAVHTLKGVSLNLGFDALSTFSVELTENLRNGSFSEGWKENYDQLCQVYNEIVNGIKLLDS